MRTDRLLAIILRLLERRQVTASELADDFGTSERTIYRDMEALSLAGVPLAALPGPGGGYRLAEGYALERGFLSPEEILSLMSALSSIEDATKDRRLGLILGKLSAMGDRPQKSLSSLPPSVVLSLNPWGMTPPGSELAEPLRSAIESRRLVSFSYQSMRGPTVDRLVEPFTLAIGGSIFYLHGWCRLRGAFRIFRLSRIEGLRIMDERYDPQSHGTVPPVWGGSWGQSSQLDIRLSFPPAARLSVLDSFRHDEVTSFPDGHMEARFTWPAADPPLRFILGFGPGVEVLEPETLRKQVSVAAGIIASENRQG